jgi:hypothetical protein
MAYNTKNYTEQGGEKTIIGGTLEIPGALDLTGTTITGAVTAAVVNNLTTTATGSALDAAQGKALKTLVDARVTTASIVNDLTTGGTTVPLSAEQGKTLGARVAANQTASVEASTPTVTEFNALLAKLKAAGLMAADA